MKNNKNIFFKIIDLLLVSDKASKDWIKEKSLLISVYIFASSITVYGIFILINLMFFEDILNNSENSTLIYRIISLGLEIIILISLLCVVYNYYRYLIKKNTKVYISNIIYFYLGILFIYTSIYLSIYRIDQTSFKYTNPPYIITKTAQSQENGITFKVYKMKIHFLMYSSFKSLTGNYFLIKTNSTAISILNWFQSLISICLISIFVASYVNQHRKDR